MASKSAQWLLLITNLPGVNQTLRMRIWRALKATGAATLRDGVYLLPDSAASRRVFAGQQQELAAGSGTAHLFSFDAESPDQNRTLIALFDRTADYATLLDRVPTLHKSIEKLAEADARRRLGVLQRELAALVATDYFPGESRRQAEAAVAEVAATVEGVHSPDEPHGSRRKIRPVDPKRYRARTWATRERLWIDRVCSAWLIRRFIDPRAKFLWLKRMADCPASAVGFDFDGAEFTHVGGRVTFEVLLHSFGLDSDAGLAGLARLVHFLDVGGVPMPEAAGLAAVVTGARQLHSDDSALLQAVSPVLDSLYAAFGNSGDRHVRGG